MGKGIATGNEIEMVGRRKKVLLFSMSLAVLALLFFVASREWGGLDEGSASDASYGPGHFEVDEADALRQQEAAIERLGAPLLAKGNRGNSSSLEVGFRWNPDNPGIAESEQDAAWLEKNGYPGADVQMYLMSLPVDSLKTLSENGNHPAQAIYALRLAQAGASHADTQDILLRSAASGSVYALKMAGDIYMTVDGYRDPAMANAFYGLQTRSGDQAGFAQRHLLGRGLSEEQRLRSEVLEELMWRNLKKTCISTPRPGFMELLEKGLQPANEMNNK
ncbi:hypothetical protein [Pseudoxanthomonas mexicana]|uniref:hypothetical protein n=1 Tax=Pseudoxanthomonas mexicana TaxID=128785 RepID=UPI00398ACAD6